MRPFLYVFGWQKQVVIGGTNNATKIILYSFVQDTAFVMKDRFTIPIPH